MLETALVKVVNAVLQILLVQVHPHNVLYSKNKVHGAPSARYLRTFWYMFQGPENALLVESVHISYNLAMGQLELLILLSSGVLRCRSSYVSQSIDYNIHTYIHTLHYNTM